MKCFEKLLNFSNKHVKYSIKQYEFTNVIMVSDKYGTIYTSCCDRGNQTELSEELHIATKSISDKVGRRRLNLFIKFLEKGCVANI